jgi:hypothetical protein
MPGNIVKAEELDLMAWAFSSFVSAGVTTQYVGGFYLFGVSNFIPAAAQALGTANVSYAAHAFIVLGDISVDMVVRVTGTSITDKGIRTPGDTEDLDTSGGLLNAYFETTKKFIGAIDIKLQSGTGINVNYGYAKYWDHNNTDIIIRGLEVTGFAGANDATPQIKLIHHSTEGWTYNGGAEPTPPAPIADLQTDHNTEFQLSLKESFAWKRDNLNTYIAGSASQGLLFSVDINNNNSISFANFDISHINV